MRCEGYLPVMVGRDGLGQLNRSYELISKHMNTHIDAPMQVRLLPTGLVKAETWVHDYRHNRTESHVSRFVAV